MDIDDIEKGLADIMAKLSNAEKAGGQVRAVVTTYFNELTNMQTDHAELLTAVNDSGYGSTVDEEVNKERLSKAIALRTRRLAAFDALNTLLGTITEF